MGCVAAAVLYPAAADASTVSYRVDFEATWSATTFPSAYPTGAHFSSLIGGVHNAGVSFWAPGQIASNGIEQMAERGGTTLLRGEVQQAVASGTAASVVSGNGTTSPGGASATFTLSDSFPLLSLVTMVAPSPDWFVGVHGLDLRGAGGWRDGVVVELRAYDAGTDNGTAFTSPDIDATPRQPIALLAAPFTETGPVLGRFRFTLLTPVPEPSGAVAGLGVIAFVRHRPRRFGRGSVGNGC